MGDFVSDILQAAKQDNGSASLTLVPRKRKMKMHAIWVSAPIPAVAACNKFIDELEAEADRKFPSDGMSTPEPTRVVPSALYVLQLVTDELMDPDEFSDTATALAHLNALQASKKLTRKIFSACGIALYQPLRDLV